METVIRAVSATRAFHCFCDMRGQLRLAGQWRPRAGFQRPWFTSMPCDINAIRMRWPHRAGSSRAWPCSKTSLRGFDHEIFVDVMVLPFIILIAKFISAAGPISSQVGAFSFGFIRKWELRFPVGVPSGSSRFNGSTPHRCY